MHSSRMQFRPLQWPSAGGGGCVCPGGVCPGGCLPQCMLGYTPPVNRMTDACENNLSATMLWTVKIVKFSLGGLGVRE